MRKIKLFGASFDPPHIGHFQILSSVLAQNLSDEIWLIPTGQHGFSKKPTESHHRIAMLELFLKDFVQQPVKIETYECRNELKSYTYDVLTYFADNHIFDSFVWIIGSDKLANFHRWYKAFELLKRFSLYVYPRPGYPMEPLYDGMVPLIGVPETKVSSTEVRNKVKLGENISDLVGESLDKYIRENRLYIR